MVALSDHNHFIKGDKALEKTPLTISARTTKIKCICQQSKGFKLKSKSRSKINASFYFIDLFWILLAGEEVVGAEDTLPKEEAKEQYPKPTNFCPLPLSLKRKKKHKTKKSQQAALVYEKIFKLYTLRRNPKPYMESGSFAEKWNTVS